VGSNGQEKDVPQPSPELPRPSPEVPQPSVEVPQPSVEVSKPSPQHNAAGTLLGGITWTVLTCSAGVVGYIIGEDVGVFSGALCAVVTGVICVDLIQWGSSI